MTLTLTLSGGYVVFTFFRRQVGTSSLQDLLVLLLAGRPLAEVLLQTRALVETRFVQAPQGAAKTPVYQRDGSTMNVILMKLDLSKALRKLLCHREMDSRMNEMLKLDLSKALRKLLCHREIGSR